MSFRKQLHLSTLLLAIAVMAILLAAFYGHPMIRLIAISVIGANVLGAIAAIIITHVLKFPRTGGYRYEEFGGSKDESK